MLYSIGVGNQTLLQSNASSQKIAALYECDDYAKKVLPDDFNVIAVKNLLAWMQQAHKQGATHVIEVASDGSTTPLMEIENRIDELRMRETIHFED